MRVLYDGWGIAHGPGDAGLHLLALLSALPEEVEPVVALPGPARQSLPARVVVLDRPANNTPAGRLGWEQRALPALARQAGAAALHVFSESIPQAAGVPVLVSPAESDPRRPGGVAARLRAALQAGGWNEAAALLWPDDLPAPAHPGSVRRLPPLAHPAFGQDCPPPPGAPPQFVLYPGPGGEDELWQLLGAWQWAGPAVGEHTPLLLAGLDPSAQAHLRQVQGELEPFLRVLPAHTPDEWAGLYQAAQAVVCLGPVAPWGDPLTDALAAGKAIVGVENAHSAARVGPAAYLVPPGEGRALGAALTTLVVEEDLAARLGTAARERAQASGSATFGARLAALYAEVIQSAKT